MKRKIIEGLQKEVTIDWDAVWDKFNRLHQRRAITSKYEEWKWIRYKIASIVNDELRSGKR